MRRSVWKAYVLVWGALLFFPARSFGASYTDEDIRKMFKDSDTRKTHSVMASQSERLRSMLDGFIRGDAQMIGDNAARLTEAMQGVAQTYPLTSENGPAVWHSASDIATQSELIKKSLTARDHRGAYAHYNLIVSNCIQCHQLVRPFGKFEEPEPEPATKPVEDPPSKNKAKQPTKPGPR